MRTNQLLIFLLALLIIMPLVSSAKPFVTIPDSSGLQFAYSPYEVVKSNTNFTLHLHVINKTAIQTNTTTSCLLHLYNSVGLHILENKLEWDSNNVEFKLLITGGNFTVGQHAYIIQCNNTNKEISLINGVFMANKNGNVMTNSESITVFWNIMIIITALLSFMFMGFIFKIDSIKIFFYVLAGLTLFILIGIGLASIQNYITYDSALQNVYSAFYIIYAIVGGVALIGLVIWLIYYVFTKFSKTKIGDFDED
jgi:hypothetical protein